MSEMTMTKLHNVCEFAKDKISINKLSVENYISTENMLPERNGVTMASGLPTTSSISAYKVGDVLISNIRPYFKKIWYSNKHGGCSNDVLVFRANKNYNSRFLYYVLSDDRFFDYSVSTSKGTKMPRGDKSALMDYIVPLPPLREQRTIAATLSCLDEKIELNNRINKNLEEMAQIIFKSWFVDFEPFKNGEFEDSELGKIPKGWNVKNLPEVIDINPIRQLKRGAITPYVEMKNLPDSYARIRKWDYRPYNQSGAKFKNDDVLLARITPCLENGKTAYVDFMEEDEVGWGSTEYLVFAPKQKLSGIFVYILCRSEHFRSHAIANMTGTSGRQRVPANCFQDYKIIVPDAGSLKTQLSHLNN